MKRKPNACDQWLGWSMHDEMYQLHVVVIENIENRKFLFFPL